MNKIIYYKNHKLIFSPYPIGFGQDLISLLCKNGTYNCSCDSCIINNINKVIEQQTSYHLIKIEQIITKENSDEELTKIMDSVLLKKGMIVLRLPKINSKEKND